MEGNQQLHPVQLREVFLASMSFNRLEEFPPFRGPLSVHANNETRVVSDTEVRAAVDVSVVFPESGDPHLAVTARGIGVFVCDPGYASIREFVEAQGGYFVYTFLRSAIASVTAHSGLPPIMLPLVAVTGPRESKEEA